MHQRRTPPAADTAVLVPRHGSFVDLALTDLVATPLNPRRHLDETELGNLANSIAEVGIIEPLVVRVAAQAGKFEIVAGMRRARAARMVVGLETVPCMLRELTDVQVLELALAENNQRAGVHPLEEAEGMRRLQELDPAYTTDAIASRLGRSVTYVRDRLHLLNLVDVVREAYERDVITAKHAEIIARLPADQQLKAFEECFMSFIPGNNDEMGMMREKAIAQLQWDGLAQALVGTRDLQRWVTDYAKRDIDGPEVQQELRALLADESDDADVDDDASTLLQLSADKYLGRKEAKAAGVIAPENYKDITGKKACKYAKRGAIVHPADAELRILTVCTSRACSTHHPKPKATGSRTGSRPEPRLSFEEEQRKRREAEEREKARWKEIGPAVTEAMATAAGKLKFGAQFVIRYIGQSDVDQVRKVFGIKLTDKTAAQVLALHDHTGIDYPWQRDRAAKNFGINLKAIEKQVDARAAKAAGAKKPAPAKKRK